MAKSSSPPASAATLDDLARARDAGAAVELVAGEVIEKAIPSAEHGLAEVKVGALLDPYNRRTGGPRGPGGWWILSEVEIALHPDERSLPPRPMWVSPRAPA